MSELSPEERLDEANRATFVKHWRNILDRGLTGEDSALDIGARGPGSPGLLAALRANAIEYAGGQRSRPRPKG